MRPMLRPGTHVLRRGAGQLQVGLDPESALVLPDSPTVRDSLRLLTGPAHLDGRPDPATVGLLDRHHELIEERDLGPAVDADSLTPHAAAALARCTGPRTQAARRSRAAFRTRTGSFGGEPATALREEFVSLTGSAGLHEAAPRSERQPDCGVVLGVGEPGRELLDPWTRAGTPYLLVRLVEGRAVVGPFVVPGSTACLRCIDAHCTDADPAWPLLVRQYAEASSRPRADGAPEPVDPLLATLALAWAARDLTSYVDGFRPSTWSATVTLHPRLSRLETRPWLRHAACPCTWD
jgi:bacteriocin biosynthesis cyclodehydratase domain-containing protein